MNEENQVPHEGAGGPEAGSASSAEGSWQEVGKKFEELGASLAYTVRTAWEHEETQRRLQEMRTGLEAMVRDVSQAIEDSANSPQGQRIRQDANRAAETVRSATEQTINEARPQILNALQQLNEEIQKLTQRMQQQRDETSSEGVRTPGDAASNSTSSGDPQI
jgi:methyl-accepting chemotaxis protein